MQLSLFSATINSTILTEEAVVTILKDNDMKERLTEFVKANPNRRQLRDSAGILSDGGFGELM